MSDIYTVLKPVLYFSAALGMGPFAIDDGSKKLKPTKWRISYTLAVCGLYTGISCYGLYQRLTIKAASFRYIGEYTYLILLMCGVVVALCSLILTVVQRKKIAAMVENFHGVDNQMAKLDVHMPYRRIFPYSCAATLGLVLLMTALLAHDFLTSDENLGFFFWITYFLPVICSTCMEYQFISGGLLLRKNFGFLNERLAKFAVEFRNVDSGGKKTVGDGYFENHLILRSEQREFDFSRFRIRKILPREELVCPPLTSLGKVKAIRKIHNNLCEIKELLNSSYSLQLLSAVAQAFVIITANLYSLFTSGSQKGIDVPLSLPIIWALFRSLELVCITVTCAKISKTANYTAVIVHKLLSQDWNPSIRNQLKLFSIQLLHRKISFSACGFFTLDMTLLHAIIGAATTYLVILIQFHNTFESS